MERQSKQLSVERVPRYTSYPTAPHFHEGVDADLYGQWLNALNKSHALSLYFHIPFCRQLCWFCGCHTKIVNHYEPIARYLSLLEQEIALVGTQLPDCVVTHIHFGGGSPTAAKAEDFSRIMSRVRKDFSILDKAEIAIEIDPRTVDAQKIAAYAQSGVTRASLGVQDFDLKVQEAINRVQPYEMVSDVLLTLREHGIDAINTDLIYGLPFQTLNTIKQTVELTLSLEPDRISLFGYAHVPWMKKHQKLVPEDMLPDKELRIAMYDTATTLLKRAGYIAIGLDHFAKPEDALAKALQNGSLRRNFQGYTTDTADALLGLGVSSISSLPQGYVQNTSSNIDYAQCIKAGILPVARGIELSNEDKKRRDIIMSLMCNMSAQVPQELYAEELERLKPYFSSGDLAYEGKLLLVHPSAQNSLRLIASIFDSYLTASSHRYSQAV